MPCLSTCVVPLAAGPLCDGMLGKPNPPTTQPESVIMNILRAAVFASVLTAAIGLAGRAHGADEKPKYYFKITNITADDKSLIPTARELLEKEILTRAEFTNDLGGAEDEAAAQAEMKKRGLRGYQVNLRIMGFKQDEKPPVPGRRDPQMAIQVKLGVYGSTYPGGKIAFTGDGEAAVTGEDAERRKEKDVADLTKMAMSGALKQAVSTAVTKMTTETLPDSPRRKKHKKK
jgi:hypothetical protein